MRLLDGVPQAWRAISATGLTSREYVLTQGALLQAGMAYAIDGGHKRAGGWVVNKAG